MDEVEEQSLEKELQTVLNRHSAENASNTPDFILAQFLIGALETYGTAAAARDAWYGINPAPGWKDGEDHALHLDGS